VGSKTFDGVRFSAYVDDHLPPHVHGFYAGVEVILELDFETRDIRLARRHDRVQPQNAKSSDVRRVRRAAEEYGEELFRLWEVARG
jgi:hypothetical protein